MAIQCSQNNDMLHGMLMLSDQTFRPDLGPSITQEGPPPTHTLYTRYLTFITVSYMHTYITQCHYDTECYQ